MFATSLSKGNLGNISNTISINFSIKPRVMEHIEISAECSLKGIETYTTLFKEFHNIFAWSYTETPLIELHIVILEIKIYPRAKPVRKNIRPIHPRKVANIKVEFKKKLHVGFIYSMPLT